jgi:hypothetical protein
MSPCGTMRMSMSMSTSTTTNTSSDPLSMAVIAWCMQQATRRKVRKYGRFRKWQTGQTRTRYSEFPTYEGVAWVQGSKLLIL